MFAAVDLDHDAVDLEWQVVALLVPSLDESDDVIERLRERALRIQRQSEFLQEFVGGRLRLHTQIVRSDKVIEVRAEVPLRGELRIFLAQRARRGVARIG